MIEEIFEGCKEVDERIPQEHLEDFWLEVNDLDSEAQGLIEALPDVIDILPPFIQKWTVAELWSAIRDR